MNRVNYKIGVILDCEPSMGGSFQYALSLLEAVCFSSSKRGYKVCAFINNDNWLQYLDHHIDTIFLESNRILNAVMIDEQNCLVVFASLQSDWSNKLLTPVVVPIHDLMHRYEKEFPEVGDSEENANRDIMYHGNVRNAVSVLVDSEIGAAHVIDTFGQYYKDKVMVLPFAAPRYMFEDEKRIDIPYEKYIFYPAQFWCHKNHKNLIKAIALLKDRGISINCIFVGHEKNGYEEAINLIEKYELSEQISILGYVENAQMVYLYKHARAMIMPTYFGPTNIPPIEAIVSGCPVAVSNVYAMPDQLKDAAVYFDPGNPEEIATVVQRYWVEDDFCREMIMKGKTIAGYFTQDSFNKRFDLLIADILQRAEQKKEYAVELITFCRKFKRIFVYGAGDFASITIKTLEKLHIHVDGIIVTSIGKEKEKLETAFDKNIETINEHLFSSDDGIICSVYNPAYRQDIRKTLEQKIQLNNVLFIDGRKVKDTLESYI